LDIVPNQRSNVFLELHDRSMKGRHLIVSIGGCYMTSAFKSVVSQRDGKLNY
jgi:hypothetical protein